MAFDMSVMARGQHVRERSPRGQRCTEAPTANHRRLQGRTGEGWLGHVAVTAGVGSQLGVHISWDNQNPRVVDLVDTR